MAVDFNDRNAGTGRVATEEEFVEYFLKKMEAVPDENFDMQVAKFLIAAAAAKRFVRESTIRAQGRRDKIIAVFKGFDVRERGQIGLEEFKNVGEALNWDKGYTKWTSRQNKALFRSMDQNDDGLVVLEEFLYFYRSVIYDIPDDQFERGLKDFHKAVQHCCEASGVHVEFSAYGIDKTTAEGTTHYETRTGKRD